RWLECQHKERAGRATSRPTKLFLRRKNIFDECTHVRCHRTDLPRIPPAGRGCVVSGMYPILWAMKHAPCADVYEQAVLIQMADASDEDGCNSYLAVPTIADRIAGDIDPKTVRRKQDAMAKRGLLRPGTTPPPPRYLKIPKNRRPKRWELCIPHSWWSDAQREAVQRGREDRGLPPITPENRPDLAPAPPKTVRSDKGKERPERRKKSDWGDSQSPQLPEPGGTLSPPQGGLSVPPRG